MYYGIGNYRFMSEIYDGLSRKQTIKYQSIPICHIPYRYTQPNNLYIYLFLNNRFSKCIHISIRHHHTDAHLFTVPPLYIYLKRPRDQRSARAYVCITTSVRAANPPRWRPLAFTRDFRKARPSCCVWRARSRRLIAIYIYIRTSTVLVFNCRRQSL